MYRILVVDDSMIIRNKISRIPMTKGYKIVDFAKNGREAVEKYQYHKTEIVTLDLTMPEMDGLDVIPRLLAQNPNVLILVISALSDQATGLEALELGASGFLNKPFTDQQVQISLDRMIKYSKEKEAAPVKKKRLFF